MSLADGLSRPKVGHNGLGVGVPAGVNYTRLISDRLTFTVAWHPGRAGARGSGLRWSMSAKSVLIDLDSAYHRQTAAISFVEPICYTITLLQNSCISPATSEVAASQEDCRCLEPKRKDGIYDSPNIERLGDRPFCYPDA